MTLAERLIENRRIDDNGCWIWTKAKRKGYGRIKLFGRMESVHRVSYELYIGPVTDLVLHRCNNRACFNPAHLYDGSHACNVEDSIRAGTHVVFGKPTTK